MICVCLYLVYVICSCSCRLSIYRRPQVVDAVAALLLTTAEFTRDRPVRFIDTGTYSSLYAQYSLAAKAKQAALERTTGVRYLPPRMGGRHFVSMLCAACMPADPNDYLLPCAGQVALDKGRPHNLHQYLRREAFPPREDA